MRDAATSPDGIPIVYDIDGSGDPCVFFVHGWSCDRSYWIHQMRSFAPRHRVVSVDLAGHGESGTGRESWTMPAFGGDVAAVARRIGADDVVLVGHSMGGDVIVDAALQLGGRVRGLVWIDVYSDLTLDEADATGAARIRFVDQPPRRLPRARSTGSCEGCSRPTPTRR